MSRGSGRLLPPGGADPPLDGQTPVYEPVGSDPRVSPGLDRPPGSIARFGVSSYVWKTGTNATDWLTFPQVVAISAGTETAGGTVVLSNLALGTSNGGVVSFGMSSSTITARVNGAFALFRISAGTLDTTYRPIGPAGLTNSMGFFFFGNWSHSQLDNDTPRLSVQAVALAAGGSTQTSGTAVLSNSNGINFGYNGSTITASPQRLSYLENWRAADLLGRDISASIGSLGVQRLAIPQVNVSATQMDFNLFVSNSSSAGATMSLRVGVYTMNGSTASLASSASASYAYNSTLGGSSSYTNVSNWRVYSVPANFNLTPGDYLLGFNIDIATALTSGTHSMMCARNSTFLGAPYVSQNYSKYFDMGQVATNGIPSSLHLSAITQTAVSNSEAPNFPWFKLVGTF